jgi:hypothetical protein
MSSKDISIKLNTFAHTEFNLEKFSDPKIIEKKIDQKIDLFERGHQYKKVLIDRTFPENILKNRNNYKKYIIE